MAATTSTRGISYWTKLALTLFLAAALLACAGATAYIVLNPVQKDKFTELSILGPDGRAEGYPAAMVVGENKTIFACVENHEDADTWYDLMVTYSNNTTKKTAYSEHFYLEDNGTWEHPFVIMPDIPDPKAKIGFQVYKNGDMSSPYRECYMWMNVSLPYGYGQTPKA